MAQLFGRGTTCEKNFREETLAEQVSYPWELIGWVRLGQTAPNARLSTLGTGASVQAPGQTRMVQHLAQRLTPLDLNPGQMRLIRPGLCPGIEE
ncbi:unnamed protein product [Lupinus luteus]|uniref:Uncharacterized protein n=1 Tax=Lupinus luteus TaxID=3873 RepID=A0AAV1X9T3_LUPLU